MADQSTTATEFPVLFFGVIAKSLHHFRVSFLNYLFLAAVSYIPFILIDAIGSSDTLDLIEFFHGNFLDIIIFLTLPTIFMKGSVYPVATLQLFFQRFFASAVIISFIQLGTLVLFTQFFAMVSIGAILIGIIPYIFLLFAGFFLIMENSDRIISIRSNLISSITLVRTRFFLVFWNYIIITILTVIPLFFFTAWYLSDLPETSAFADAMSQSPENNQLMSQRLFELIEVFKQPTFRWSRISIHIVFRPLKSLFLAFLFLGILYQLTPDKVRSFLGMEVSNQNNTDESVDSQDDDETSFLS